MDNMEKSTNPNICELNVGNATTETDVTFSYNIVKLPEGKTLPSNIPFQAQIRYTRPDGYKCVRIITKTLQLTTDREEAEKHCDVAIVGLSAVQQTAKLALEANDMENARKKLHCAQRLLKRAAKSTIQKEEYSNFVRESDALDCQLMSAKTAINGKEKGNEDATAKVLYKMKGAAKNDFLCGKRKKLEKRLNADDKLTKMYYDYKFNDDANLVKQ